MSKRELIDEIVRLNPTAKTEFLARFPARDLQEYLEHLNWVIAPAAAARQMAVQPPDATDATQDSPEISSDEMAGEYSASEECYTGMSQTEEVVAVAAGDKLDEPLPFAEQSQEESQTYLF